VAVARPRTRSPAPGSAVTQRAAVLEREHAARRRHAAPPLEQYLEAHDLDDQGLDVVVDALRSARTRVAPAALSLAAAAVTPLDAASFARDRWLLTTPPPARIARRAAPRWWF